MKLTKAQEILDLNIKLAGTKIPPDTLEAVKLATEALKRVQQRRADGWDCSRELLPGETKE